MFNIITYKDRNGKDFIVDLFETLKKQSEKNKTHRIQRHKIILYLDVLRKQGTRAGLPIMKHIDADLWELRPIDIRILFAYWKDKTFVLLHYFIKKTQKTPRKEIEQAKKNLKDFLERSENND